jgi:hypothetical protein
MAARTSLAVSKGCDGVDPDNVDGYNNDNSLGLTKADAIDYLNFLANNSHSLELSISPKNAGDIVNTVLPIMDWAVNEQRVQYDECDLSTFHWRWKAGPSHRVSRPDAEYHS